MLWSHYISVLKCKSFYFSPPGDAVSMAFMQSYIEVSESLEGNALRHAFEWLIQQFFQCSCISLYLKQKGLGKFPDNLDS